MTTGDPRLEAQLAATVELLHEVFRDAVVGVYLYGSAVLGGLRGRSDVDVLGILDRPSTDRERRAVVDGLLDFSGRRARRGPDRPMELTLVVASDVRPWRYPPRMELLYGEWLRDELTAGPIPEPRLNPDLATVLAMARERGRALVGPPIAQVLDPVPLEDRRRAMLDSIPSLLDDLAGDEANVLLTLARIWRSLVLGDVVPKDVAADWAIDRLPAAERPPLARARGVYLGDAPDEWADLRRELEAVVRRLIAEIKRSSG